MAWDFAAEIHALSGFDADGSGSVDGIDTGETFQVHANQWLTDGAKEIISNLPRKLKEECATITKLYIGNTDVIMDLDVSGEIFYVTRENADSGYYTECRKISSVKGGMAESGSGHMFYEPTADDPVYWTGSDDSGDPKLFVKPTPTANQPAKIYHISYPTVTYSQNIIANFPDEAEHLVVLYAAIKATEYMMLSEEDQEVYAPQLATLKQDYAQGLASLKGGQ